MNQREWNEFLEAARRIPKPIECFSDGASCPWCGCMHRTVTFGANGCDECAREFYFGYPDWSSHDGPVSWVPFPHREFDAVGRKARFLDDWKPNDRLKHHYHQKAEESTGIFTDRSKPQ